MREANLPTVARPATWVHFTGRMLGVLFVLFLLAGGASAAGKVALIKVKGTINPATAGYISRAIDRASADRAECLVLQLDTPGGLLDSTKEIVQSFYDSAVPVVVFVGPAGANATSAGCFITLASDVAAMAPNTSIGAAHPVSIGGGGASGGEEKKDGVMEQKIENFAVSYIETIAQKRGRNAEWAKSAVRESANITAEIAQKTNVIEIIAEDLPNLLQKLDGRTVKERALKTAGAEVVEISPNLRERVFQMAWRPEVLMILMMIAIYGIIAEVSNPGGIIPGVVGVVALILALYMSSALPVNVAGVALMVLAVGLFIAEVFTPTFGVLTGAGTIAFFFGLLMLFDRADPAFRVSLKLIIPATILTSVFFLFVVAAGLRAQRLPTMTGVEGMIGQTAPAATAITPEGGRLFVEGEYWSAISDQPVAEGEMVEILAVDGLRLKVRRTQQAS